LPTKANLLSGFSIVTWQPGVGVVVGVGVCDGVSVGVSVGVQKPS
jgi:hypothetical protein